MLYGESVLVGKLIVTGENEVRILLKYMPNDVVVKFIDDYNPSSCNSNNHDMLVWEIEKKYNYEDSCHDNDFNYHFIIKWMVAGIREISWEVFYFNK